MLTSSPRMAKEEEVQPTTNTAITTANIKTKTVNVIVLSRPPKRGPLSVLLAFLFMAKNRHTKPPEKPAGRVWKSLICGIRPLHHIEEGGAPTPRPIPLPAARDSFHDVPLPPPSPPGSISGMSSDYGSALDLQALDNNNDNSTEDDESSDVSDDGPNLIDMQAEEFIARFYEQMKLQRNESMATRGN